VSAQLREGFINHRERTPLRHTTQLEQMQSLEFAGSKDCLNCQTQKCPAEKSKPAGQGHEKKSITECTTIAGNVLPVGARKRQVFIDHHLKRPPKKEPANPPSLYVMSVQRQKTGKTRTRVSSGRNSGWTITPPSGGVTVVGAISG
jgi:hypothetical protein